MKKKNDSILPFNNEVTKAKNDFKQMIDKMSEDEFLSFTFFIETTLHPELEDDWDDDWNDCDCEECRKAEEELYELPFSGEMINFKCKKCNKFSALEVEIVDDMYDSTHEVPSIACFHCDNIVTPVYYKSPDNKIFKD